MATARPASFCLQDSLELVQRAGGRYSPEDRRESRELRERSLPCEQRRIVGRACRRRPADVRQRPLPQHDPAARRCAGDAGKAGQCAVEQDRRILGVTAQAFGPTALQIRFAKRQLRAHVGAQAALEQRARGFLSGTEERAA